MLHRLNYSVTFPSTGRALAESIDFQTGFGTITGPNEAGKSMVLEMVRFSLFGTAALRGNADNYKALKTTLDFTIKGVRYQVDRTISKATLKQGEEILATGTRPVNEKITGLFGYGLEVFDMAHVANQDQLLSLGDMRPTERKRAVDSVIGLSVLDDMAKMATDEANQATRMATALEESIEALAAPALPSDYRPVAELTAELTELQKVKAEAMQLTGWLQHSKTEPIRPVCDVTETEEYLEDILAQQQTLKNQILQFETELRLVPKPSNYTVAQLDEIETQITVREQQNARATFERNNPQPMLNQEQITQLNDDWALWELFEQRSHLLKKREDLLSQGSHTCPSCTYNWPVASAEIGNLDVQITGLRNVPDGVVQPVVSKRELKAHQETLDNWNRVSNEWSNFAQLPVELINPELSMQQLIIERAGVGSQVRIDALNEQLATLKSSELFNVRAGEGLELLRNYKRDLERYDVALVEYQDWLVEKGRVETKLALYQIEVQKIPQLEAQLSEAQMYERLFGIYESKLEQQNRTLEQVREHNATAEDWRKVRTALTILRGLVKQYLLPPLNKTASYLLQQMTGGQRQSVVVDEEFDILIDGQPIKTLSGSGKAVANLALRIGLGQVLTNNVMSLFMGDEIDGSMDEVRSENTSKTMSYLSSKMSQILLVTHKFPAADYYIRVGDNYEKSSG